MNQAWPRFLSTSCFLLVLAQTKEKRQARTSGESKGVTCYWLLHRHTAWFTFLKETAFSRHSCNRKSTAGWTVRWNKYWPRSLFYCSFLMSCRSRTCFTIHSPFISRREHPKDDQKWCSQKWRSEYPKDSDMQKNPWRANKRIRELVNRLLALGLLDSLLSLGRLLVSIPQPFQRCRLLKIGTARTTSEIDRATSNWKSLSKDSISGMSCGMTLDPSCGT